MSLKSLVTAPRLAALAANASPERGARTEKKTFHSHAAKKTPRELEKKLFMPQAKKLSNPNPPNQPLIKLGGNNA